MCLNVLWLIYRGGKYSEEDTKTVLVQILNVVSYCHLQGVIHRDLKPEVEIFCSLYFKVFISFTFMT